MPENCLSAYQIKHLPICFTISMIQICFRFDTGEKIKSLGNSDDIADQITG